MFNFSACPAINSIPMTSDLHFPPSSKNYWDEKYGSPITEDDFADITSNLKRFARFLKEL